MSKKILAFGGSGKTVALIYIKLCNLTGYPAKIVVVDFPPQLNPNATDSQLDAELAQSSGATVQRINTLPDNQALKEKPLREVFNLDSAVADALFTEDQQRTPPVRGLNAEPQVGACVAQLKLKSDAAAVRSTVLTGEQHVYFVAGLGGGTGAGVTHQFAQFLSEANIVRHGVFMLPWRDIGTDGTVSNAQQMRNAASVLSYLKDRESKLYNDLVVIGGSEGTEMYKSSANNHRAIHPTLILAALYLLMDEAWGGDANLTMARRRLETPAGGINPREIKTAFEGKSLYEMLVVSRRRVKMLRDLANEDPDQVLTFLSLAPLSSSLACMPLRWLLKYYAHRTNQHDFASAWSHLSGRLKEVAANEEAGLTWILDLLSDKRVFNFDADQLNRDAMTNYDRYLNKARASTIYKDFELEVKGADQALKKTVEAIYDRMITPVLMER